MMIFLSIEYTSKRVLEAFYWKEVQLKCWENGEGNGTPLQYSWLENPMDGGAW